MPWLGFGTTTRELHDGDVVVGSGSDADWRVTAADLAQRHFVVSVRGESASVRASSGHNVIVVNGRQVATDAVAIGEGDAILAGSGRFAYSVQRPTTATMAESSVEPAYLVDDAGKVAHPLTARSSPIGRDASNAVVVRDPTASRFHAEVRREAGGFVLRSMGASGTILNGQELARPLILADGDVAEIAFAKLRFTRQSPTGDITLAPPHSTLNDETARKPTLEGSERVVVDEDSSAGRHSRRVQALVALGIVLLAVIWWSWRGHR